MILGSYNCCLCDVETILKGGFEIANVHYNEPNSVLSALQVVGDITLSASACQFGGFTLAELDRVMVRYCEKTLINARKEVMELGIEDEEKIEAFAWKRLKRELEQGIQSLEVKLNTINSSRGDFAFVTVTFGAMPKGATELEKKIQRLICSTLLSVRKKGHGKNGLTVVFPKLVMLVSQEQLKEPEQKKLFREAIECSARAMYPDYLAIDSDYGDVSRIYKESGKITSPMG